VVKKLILGLVLVGGVTLGLSFPAFAAGCYTGCVPSPPGLVGGGPSVSPSAPSVSVPLPAPSESVPGGLPFTGADIAQSVAIAVVLLVAGTVLVRINRRKARTTP
jgi:hypothetical protein